MNKKELFRELYKSKIDNDAYLETIPKDINTAFFDNKYVNNLEQDKANLIKLAFGEHWYSIEWFLNEWKPGYEVGMKDVFTKINDIDQYIQWMEENEGF